MWQAQPSGGYINDTEHGEYLVWQALNGKWCAVLEAEGERIYIGIGFASDRSALAACNRDYHARRPTAECHACGAPVRLRPATVAEAWQHGCDASYDGEYLLGQCRRLYNEDGTRNHYTYPTTIVHHTDVKEACRG